jgi:hypothetical protein
MDNKKAKAAKQNDKSSARGEEYFACDSLKRYKRVQRVINETDVIIHESKPKIQNKGQSRNRKKHAEQDKQTELVEAHDKIQLISNIAYLQSPIKPIMYFA